VYRVERGQHRRAQRAAAMRVSRLDV
jgi:hypothetical protein